VRRRPKNTHQQLNSTETDANLYERDAADPEELFALLLLSREQMVDACVRACLEALAEKVRVA
jgi:hypothetical protein